MLSTFLLAGCAILAQADAAGDLDLEVRGLVRRLNAPQLAQREEAERQLLDLGPKVLELLPEPNDRLPVETQQRLARVRQKLQQAATEQTAQGTRITLDAKEMPLPEVLAALEAQSGNKIELATAPPPGEEVPKLTLSLEKVLFWQALDQVLDQSGLTVESYGEPGRLRLVGRLDENLKRSGRATYSGPFRIEPVFIEARRDLRNPAGKLLRLTLDVAWEPRLAPISLTQKLADLSAVAPDGTALPVDDPDAELDVPADGLNSVQLPIPLALPPRSVTEIASLRSKLTAMLPGKVERFAFDDLQKAEPIEKRIAGAVVKLEQVRKNNAAWEIRIRVTFDSAGDALESYRGWIFKNEAFLETPDGKRIDHDGYETVGRSRNAVGLSYLFVVDSLAGYKFVYTTPGAILPAAFDYEIKSVPLP